MNNRKSQPSTNAKSSTPKRPNLTYAQSAGNSAAGSASPGGSDKPSSATPTPAAPQSRPGSHGAAARQGRQQSPENAPASTTNNDGSGPAVTGRSASSTGGPRSRSRDMPVRMPTRNSVSSGAAPAIQFGSLHQQARASPPPAAHRPAAGAATSGGVPVASGKPASRPSFGTVASSGEDSGRKQHSSHGASDAPSRGGHHGRQQGHQHHHSPQQQQQQQQQQQRPASRSSGHGRQGYGAGRKDNAGNKHGAGPKGAPKPHDVAGSSGASESPEAPPSAVHADSAGGYPAGQQATMPMPIPTPQGGMAAQPHYAGSPYRGQGHQHVRPPHTQSPGGPFKPQAGTHYPPPPPPHHMGTQPMSRPMAYPMPGPGQPPMQPAIMSTQPNMPPMQGWMPPPHQFAYMPMGTPGYEQYYRQPQSTGVPPPHSMYGVPGYSMPNPAHAAVSSQIGAGGIMPNPMGGAHMPGMTASPMPGHPHAQHHSHLHALSATAQAFIPGVRRPVRIVDPTTNEEVDVSQQRLRSASAASSTPQVVPSGTASPAPGSISEKNEAGADASVAEESAKPKFKLPSARAIKIVNPNLVAKPDSETVDAKSSATPQAEPAAEEPKPAITPPKAEPVEPAAEPEAPKADSGPEPMDVDEEAVETKDVVVEAKAVAAEEPKQETPAVAPVEPKEATPAEEPKVVAPIEEAKAEAAPEATAEAPAEQASPREPEPAQDEASVAALADSLSKATIADAAAAQLTDAASPANEEANAMDVDAEEAEEAEEQEDEDEDVDEDVDEDEEVESPRDTAEASADDEPEASEGEEGEIDEDTTAEKPPTSSQGRTRQVTFSESTAPEVRALSPSEVLKRYEGDAATPRIVDEILKYPRAFLERFNGLCRPPERFHFEITSTDDRWPSDRGSGMRRSASGSGRHRDSTVASGFGGMGNFRSHPVNSPKLSSEERFKQSTMDLKHGVEPARGPMLGARSSSGQFRGPAGGRESRGGRTSGGAGRGRGRGRGRGGSQMGGVQPVMSAEFLANLKPLEKGENRYIAKVLRTDKDGEEEDEMAEETYDRRIRVLLNKITPDNFGIVSDQLLEWGEKSAKETDGRIMRHLLTLIFEKATDEPMWAEMYARLCHKLIVETSSKVQDHGLPKDGGFLSGGFLVRKYLLTKCQEDFERGWRVEIPMDIESAEYYDAITIKRRGLGLVTFIGELFLLDVLTLRIMHECVKRLLTNYQTPEEEETESLAKLLTTVGKKLDNDKSTDMMDAYFARIRTMGTNKTLSSRIRFMIQDLIELRQKRWPSANDSAGPKTIAEVHEDIERAKATEAAMRRAPSHAGRRTESHSGRGDGHGPGGRRGGGWSMVGGPSGSGREQPQRAGDLSQFGNLKRSNQSAQGGVSLGGGSPGNPFGTFAPGGRGWRSGSSDGRKGREERPAAPSSGLGSRTVSHSSRNDSVAATPESVGGRNMFAALEANDEEESPRVEAAKDVSRVPSLPRTAMSSSSPPASAAAQPKAMDTATLQRKVQGLISEYLQLKSETELVECFKELGDVNVHNAVYEIANNVMTRRPDEAEQVAKGVRVLREKGLVSEDVAVAALAEYSEQLEDMALDAPNAYKFFGMMMAAARIPIARATEPVGDLASRVSTLRPPVMQVVLAFVKHLGAMDGVDATKAAIAEAKLDIKPFFNAERNSDEDIKKILDFQDMLDMFPAYA